MAFTYNFNQKRTTSEGSLKVRRGTYVNDGGSTGGTIDANMDAVLDIQLQPFDPATGPHTVSTSVTEDICRAPAGALQISYEPITGSGGQAF